ncbi:nucleotidyltransferase domain-containing protein [Legionella pneumophila]|nr:nucleotidyltransferase domain-containing protein [Legionella pneumophila]
MNQNECTKLNDPVIKALYEELSTKYNCHTIILYGSRAIGKATSASDYDIAGICNEGEMKRISRFDPMHQVFIDLFIYPESAFDSIKDEHLIMHDGIVLKEKEQFGTSLLRQINAMVLMPPQLADYELEVRRVWYEKMLMRAKISDVDGNYRRVWLLHTLIEDYFAFRHMRYLGPKKSFEYLREHDGNVFKLYERVLSNMYDTERLDQLIKVVLTSP